MRKQREASKKRLEEKKEMRKLSHPRPLPKPKNDVFNIFDEMRKQKKSEKEQEIFFQKPVVGTESSEQSL